MQIKTLLIGAALLAAVTPPSFAESQEVTAAWIMGDNNLTTLAPVITPEGSLTSTVSATLNYTGSKGDAALGKRTAKPAADNNIPLTTVKNLPIGKNDNVYIQYTLTPAKKFSLNNISIDAWGIKFGGGRFDVVIEQGTTSINVVTGQQTARTQEDANNEMESKSGYTFSYPITTDASADEIVVKIYPYTGDASEGREVGFANVIFTGVSYDEGDEPVKPEIPDGAVVAPLAYGTFYDVTKSICTVANYKVTDTDQYIENTKKGTTVDFPFYLENEENLYFYIESGAKNEAWLKVYVDNEYVGEHKVKNTSGYANYDAYTILKFPTLASGRHTLTITRDDERTTDTYAGNWKVGLYDEKAFCYSPIDLEAGKYHNGIRSENGGANVGNIKDGAYVDYLLYVSETGNYSLNIGLSPYNGGTCTVTIAEDNIEVSFPVINEARAYSDVRQIPLGDINTTGSKTLRLAFSSEDTGSYITNYDQLSLVRNGLSGIADTEVAEEVAVEYYNLQGVRVEAGTRGTVIRVATAADGSRKATKVVVR